MTLIAKTDHVEIERREARKHIYYIIWFYDGRGNLAGFDKVYDVNTAFKLAINYVEEVIVNGNNSSTAASAQQLSPRC